jgi:hypothetical protein
VSATDEATNKGRLQRRHAAGPARRRRRRAVSARDEATQAGRLQRRLAARPARRRRRRAVSARDEATQAGRLQRRLAAGPARRRRRRAVSARDEATQAGRLQRRHAARPARRRRRGVFERDEATQAGCSDVMPMVRRGGVWPCPQQTSRRAGIARQPPPPLNRPAPPIYDAALSRSYLVCLEDQVFLLSLPSSGAAAEHGEELRATQDPQCGSRLGMQAI